jgi:hypothetical protein
VLRAPDAGALPASHPARDKIAAAPDGAAFVCVGERCSLPVTTAEQLGQAVRAMAARGLIANLKPFRSESHAPRPRACCSRSSLSRRRARRTGVRVELNTLETADNRCRMTFVIENKTSHAVDSLKLDLALFNAEGAVYRRMVADMGPVRAAKTVVKTFATDGDCAQLGSVLVNEVTACIAGRAECMSSISSRCRRA